MMAVSINKQIGNRAGSAVNVCKVCIEKINKLQCLNAFITVMSKSALKQAEESDRRHLNGNSASILDGLPIAIKDNFCVADNKTTCASKMLENFISPYDATVVHRLKMAGAAIIGKTNLDEFAMGSGTVDSIYGPTKNIWGSGINASEVVTDVIIDSIVAKNTWRVAGGSSGGSAVAVAAGMCFAALGSDTGGSTRNPASYCGVVGFKPTYGAVSRHGLIPLVNSMDVPGIIARKVDHVEQVFDIISGVDEKDSTTIRKDCSFRGEIDVKELCIGIPDEYDKDEMSAEVRNVWKAVADTLSNSGALVKRVSLPHTEASIVTYSILNQCEVASNMARYSGLLYGHRSSATISTDHLIAESRKQGLGSVIKSRILAGNYFLLQRNYERYFSKAMKVRRLISNDFAVIWSSGIDFLLTPTTLTTAPLLSDFIQLDNRQQCSTQDYCTQPANMAGCPAISIPVCLSKDGLPISLQIMANNFHDKRLLTFSKWLESTFSFPHYTRCFL